MTRRGFVLALGAAPLAAAEQWEQSQFPNWSTSMIDRVLTDSPWAKQLTVPFEYRHRDRKLISEFQIGLPGGIGWPTGRGRTTTGPGTGTGTSGGSVPSVRTEVYLTLRWSSALPIRQALALNEFGRDGLSQERAVELLTRQDTDAVLEIFGLPVTMVPQGTKALEAELEKSAMLWCKGQRALHATSVRVPEHGYHLSAELRFPRPETIGPESGLLEFSAEAGPIKIAHKFKLKSMIYRGRFEW
jgi:hypothetical protein